MEKLITAQYRGIKCDNPKCRWADWNVTQNQYKDYVNKPCPMCGQNLLTEECYEKTERILEVTKKLNAVLNKIIPTFMKRKMMKKKSVAFYGVAENGDLIPNDKTTKHFNRRV